MRPMGGDLSVAVLSSEAGRHTAVPTLKFRLSLSDPTGGAIHALALRAHVRIEPERRRYDEGQHERLYELFGEPAGWGRTLHPFTWAELSTVVPAFSRATEIDLAMPCSYDFDVSAHRYLHALGDGEVPLVFLFSGTTFRVIEDRLSVTPVPWNTECRYRLPVADWRAAMDSHFPGDGWLRLRRETIDAIGRIKAARALATWDEALMALMQK